MRLERKREKIKEKGDGKNGIKDTKPKRYEGREENSTYVNYKMSLLKSNKDEHLNL